MQEIDLGADSKYRAEKSDDGSEYRIYAKGGAVVSVIAFQPPELEEATMKCLADKGLVEPPEEPPVDGGEGNSTVTGSETEPEPEPAEQPA